MNKVISKLLDKAIQFVYVQLFISLASLPLLVAWGLPFSCATALGNFIFSPFLSAFLCCSSLIFFTELLSIPNGFLIYLLEKISNIWFFLLSYGSKEWMIGIPISWLPLIITCAGAAFVIVQHRVWGKRLPSIVSLSLLTIGATFIIPFLAQKELYTQIQCGKQHISLVQDESKIIIDDNGALARKIAASSWIQFTFIPELIKATGSSDIEEIILHKTNSFSLEALHALCIHAHVKKVYLPYFDTLSPSGWHLFHDFMQLVEKEQIKVVRTHQE